MMITCPLELSMTGLQDEEPGGNSRAGRRMTWYLNLSSRSFQEASTRQMEAMGFCVIIAILGHYDHSFVEGT